MINYTFIIPHKDIPDLLRRCVSSIPRRDDIEIIIVDDASDPELVNGCTMADVIEQPHVRMIFTKENRGNGYARNVGLRYATGKWTFFADADDFLMPGALEMLDKYKDSEADVVCFHICAKDCYTLEPCDRGLKYNGFMDQAVAGEISMNKLLAIAVTTWTKMVKRELYIRHDIHFQEDTRILTDLYWAKFLALKAQYIEVSPDVLYCVTERSDRMSLKFVSKEHLKQMYHVTKKINKLVVDNGKDDYVLSLEYILKRIHKNSVALCWKYYFLSFFDGTLYNSLKKNTIKQKLYRIIKFTLWLITNPK